MFDYSRKCTEEEREIFAIVYRFYEQYANAPALDSDNKTQDDYFRRLITDADALAAEHDSELLNCLLRAVGEYQNDKFVQYNRSNKEQTK